MNKYMVSMETGKQIPIVARSPGNAWNCINARNTDRILKVKLVKRNVI